MALLVAAAPALANSRSQALYAKGLVPFHNGKWDEAYKLFDEAVKADSDDAAALYYRGLTAARRGESNLAIPDMEKAAKLKPALPHVALDLGVAYFDAGQYAEAKRWLEQAHGNVDDRFHAAFFLGLTNYRLQQYDQAATYLAEAEKDPELRANAHYYAGLVALQQGQAAEGRKELEQAAQGRAESETAKAAQQYLAGGEVRRPPAPGAVPERPFWVYGDLRFNYDSNVNLGASNSPVSGTNTGESDGATVLAFGGGYNLLKRDTAQIAVSYDFYQSLFFSHSSFDLQAHQLRLEGSTTTGPVQLGLAGSYGYYLLDGNTFYQEGGVTPWVTIPEGDALSTQLYYSFRGRNFILAAYDPARDGTNNAFGVRQYALLGAEDRILSFGYQYELEDSSAHIVYGQPNTFQYQASEFDLALQFPIADIARAQAAYTLRFENYQFPDQFSTPAFSFRRHDFENVVFVSAVRDLTDYLQVDLTYIGAFNQSNIEDPYQYDRNIVSVGARVHY